MAMTAVAQFHPETSCGSVRLAIRHRTPSRLRSSTAGRTLRWGRYHPAGSPVNFAIEAFQAIGGPQLALVAGQKAIYGQFFRDVLLPPIRQFGSGFGVLFHQPDQVSISRGPVWRIEDHAEIGCHFSLRALVRHMLTGILLQVELALLPGDPAEAHQASCIQAGVIVTGDQLNPSQTALNRLCKNVRQCIQ